MQQRWLPLVVGLLLLVSLSGASAGDKDSISVDLKDFKFKVPDKFVDLFGLNEGEGKLFFYTNGTAEAVVKVPADGDYEILVKASGDKAKDERAKFKLAVDGKLIGKETELTVDDVKDYRFTAALKTGERKVSIEFTNDEYKENEYDRNLYIHGLTLKRVK
jgi:Ca-dependent carbohydrate-binding module xylan-binding